MSATEFLIVEILIVCALEFGYWYGRNAVLDAQKKLKENPCKSPK